MLRIGAIAVVALALASPLRAHEGTGTWPHAHDEDATAQPVRLERYDTLGGDFALTDTGGRTVRLRDFRGRVVLLFFGYTYCPDACPLTVAKVTQAMQLLGEQRMQVRFVFITTDAQRDTSKRLNTWLEGFNPTFIGLRGSDVQLAAIEKRFGVFHLRLPPEPDVGMYQVNHSSRLFLIDQEGVVRYLFRPEQLAESVVEGVRLLLKPRSWWARVLDWATP